MFTPGGGVEFHAIPPDRILCGSGVEHHTPRVEKGPHSPECGHTKCPKLDPVVKAALRSQTKSADGDLARIQTLVLDTVGPLADLLEQPEVTQESLTESVGQALHYLGNANANISRMKGLKDLNPDLPSLVDQADTLADAPPLLFGQGFAKKAKDHAEEVKSLRKAAPSSSKSFFKGGRPSRGGTWRASRNQPFRQQQDRSSGQAVAEPQKPTQQQGRQLRNPDQ